MNNIVQKITSDSQEVKETADVLQQVKATPQQREPNLRSEKACAKEIVCLPNPDFDNIRFRRGKDIVNMKNQIHELDKFQYRVKSQSTCEEYEVISTELGWICSCADHKFRGVFCKHLYAIFWNRQQAEAESCNQDVIQ
jgi:hypothetical protein